MKGIKDDTKQVLSFHFSAFISYIKADQFRVSALHTTGIVQLLMATSSPGQRVRTLLERKSQI